MLHSWVQPGHATPAAAAAAATPAAAAAAATAAGRGRGCIGSRRLLMLDHDDDGRKGRFSFTPFIHIYHHSGPAPDLFVVRDRNL